MKDTTGKSLFDCIPGVVMPIAQVTQKIHSIWYPPKEQTDGIEPSYSRASQLNLVIHLGLRNTEAEAKAIFDTALEFAQVHPCRIIILCPCTLANGTGELMQGKLFTLCYLGNGLQQTCCCEVLTLRYALEEANFVDDQITLWIENDLPTYYWPHRIRLDRIELNYLPFVSSCKRYIYDSRCGDANLGQLEAKTHTPRQDLLWHSMLPIRQAIAAFMSSYKPAYLVEDLERLSVDHDPGCEMEAQLIQDWLQARLQDCGAESYQNHIQPVEGKFAFKIKFHYRKDTTPKAIQMEYCGLRGCLDITAELQGKQRTTTQQVAALSPIKALEQAIFF